MELAVFGWFGLHVLASLGPLVPSAKPRPGVAAMSLLFATVPGLIMADSYLGELGRVPGGGSSDSPAQLFEKGGFFALTWAVFWFVGGRSLPRDGSGKRWGRVVTVLGLALAILMAWYAVRYARIA